MTSRESTAVHRLVVLVGALLLLTCGREKAAPDARLREVYASLPHRPLALRLSGFPHIAPAKSTRGRDEPSAGLRVAAWDVLQAPHTDPRLRAAARAFVGDWRRAAADLESALQKDPSNAALWNDLAVHQFELSRRGVEPRALGKALASVDRAIELDPSLPEPRFNRAAILDEMHLEAAAAKAWRESASREPQTRWAEEARGRGELPTPSRRDAWKKAQPILEQAALAGQTGLVDPVLRAFAQEARTHGEGPMLASWAELHLSGKTEEATRQLRMARYIGERLAKLGGDPLLRDAALAIEAATRRGRAGVLANAHAQYKRARLLIHQRQPGAAEEVMAEAERLFRAEKSPMELVARTYRVGIAFDRNRLVDATTLLDELEQRLTPELIALRAQVEWDRSRLASRRGDIYQVVRHAEAAAALYEKLREHEFAIRMHSAIVTAFTALGRADDAWKRRLLTFADATSSGNLDLLEHVVHAAAKEEILEKRFDVAASLFRTMLGEPSSSPVRRFEALLWQSFVAGRSGGATDARALANAAAAIADDELRAVADADRAFAEALLLAGAQPAKAVELLTRSIDVREARAMTEALPEAYVTRGRLYRRLGSIDRAQQDLDRALTLVEDQRTRVEPLTLRDSFFATTETACEELVALYVDRQDFASAFAVAERCRARALVDVAAGLRHEPLSAERATRKLADDVAFIHYTALPDRLIIFVLRRAGLVVRTVALTRRELAAQTAALRRAMEDRRDDAIDPLLRSLHANLIAPVAHDIAGQRLVISPDATLTAVPFAALRSSSGRYLVEDAPITIAASATLYLAGTSPRPPRTVNALLVGDPAFDSANHDLARLPQAAAEARELAASYPGATLLTDRDATPERFLRALDGADLVHIASHAVISPRDAALSTLLFAPSAGDSNGLLYQSRIAELRLPRKPLVILAGCRTASAAGGRGSIRSLALAFLAAGSRGVIGSLWNVEDEATRTVSRLLHQRLTTAPTADAVREMQLALLRSDDHQLRNPATWGAFELYGFEEENTQ